MTVHCAGMGGELDCLSDVDEKLCLQCIEANRDLVVGVKLRLTSDIANDGKHEVEAYRYSNNYFPHRIPITTVINWSIT